MSIRIVNTPELLKGITVPTTPRTTSPASGVDSVGSDTTDTGTSTYTGTLPLQTTPSGWKFKLKNYGSPSRKKNGTARDVKKVKQIFLHHTASSRIADKGKKVVSHWNGAYASANCVIDSAGHREYMIPTEYIANTQGNHIEPSRTSYNHIGVAVEMQCEGFMKFKKGDGSTAQYYSEDWSKSRYIPAEQMSGPYGFDGNPLPEGKFKGQRYLAEYTAPQVKSLAEWIKEKMLEIGLTEQLGYEWKFTQHTYNQLFPNKYSSNLPVGPKVVDGLLFRQFWQSLGTKPSTYKIRTSGYAISEDCYNFKPGVYTHSSNVAGKTDLCPTQGIINMFRNNFM